MLFEYVLIKNCSIAMVRSVDYPDGEEVDGAAWCGCECEQMLERRHPNVTS